MSLFSDYFREKSNCETIENENGFVVYQVFEDELFIKEYYIVPEKRLSNAHVDFFDKLYDVAIDKKCKYVSASVDIKCNDPETPLVFNLKNGFKIHSLSGNRIILTREL